MKIRFNEQDLIKTRERFNQTFGKKATCDLKTRNLVLLSIIHMGLLYDQVIQTSAKSETTAQILQLIKTRDHLNTIFDQVESI